MTIRDVLQQAVWHLESCGVPEARQSAEWLLAHVLGCGRLELYMRSRELVGESEQTRFLQLLSRRLRREPVAYILGWAPFYEDVFRVTPDVLIPRPETERLIDVVRAHMSAHPGRILDIGTGSGCLALTLQRLFPSAEVWGVDISPKALAVARQNGDLLARPVHWVRADVADRNFLSESPSFDLIVANPPYIPDQERSTLEPELCYEPPEALFCGTDPLRYYRLIEKHLPRLLSPGGMLAVEVHAYYGEAVRNLFCEAGWEAKLEQDYAGQPRVVWFRRPER